MGELISALVVSCLELVVLCSICVCVFEKKPTICSLRLGMLSCVYSIDKRRRGSMYPSYYMRGSGYGGK